MRGTFVSEPLPEPGSSPRDASGTGSLVFGVLQGNNAPMLLRRNSERFDGELYEYWTLREAVRTQRVPSQPVVASLGKHAGSIFLRKCKDWLACVRKRTQARKLP